MSDKINFSIKAKAKDGREMILALITEENIKDASERVMRCGYYGDLKPGVYLESTGCGFDIFFVTHKVENIIFL